jgi:hypothetical protein
MIAAPGALEDTDEFLKKMERAAKLGISQVWIAATAPDPAGFVTRLTEEVLPRLSQI